MQDITTVMLIGNTGVGKSSLGCRLLGASPIQAKEPFEVGDSANAVTTVLKHHDGYWFNQPGQRIRVVDTPGLGDPKGLMVDTENMAVVGKYLNQEPINCILFVLDLNYRVNITMRRLINIIVTKIHPADHDKLAVVINKYEHTPEAAKRRSRLLGGLDEVACRQQRIDMLIKAFSDYAKHDNLKLTQAQIASLGNRIFFVDSNYDATDMPEKDNDEQAFDCLKDWCISCDLINRANVAEDTGDVYPEWKATKDQAAAVKEAADLAEEQYKQNLVEIEKLAAQERDVAALKQQALEENARKEMELLLQKMEEADVKNEAALQEVNDKFNNQLKLIHEGHDKELQRIAQKNASDQKMAQELRVKQEALDKAKEELSEERWKRLFAEAHANHQRELTESKGGICTIM